MTNPMLLPLIVSRGEVEPRAETICLSRLIMLPPIARTQVRADVSASLAQGLEVDHRSDAMSIDQPQHTVTAREVRALLGLGTYEAVRWLRLRGRIEGLGRGRPNRQWLYSRASLNREIERRFQAKAARQRKAAQG